MDIEEKFNEIDALVHRMLSFVEVQQINNAILAIAGIQRIYFDSTITMNAIQEYLERAYNAGKYNPLHMALSPQDHERVGAQVRACTNICGHGDISHHIEELEHFTRFVNQTTGQLMKVSVSRDVPVGAIDFDNDAKEQDHA